LTPFRTNPFRFSTKFGDDESALLYYGCRFYSATSGRWIARDPEEEEGGNNLVAFVNNAPLFSFDPLGRFGLIDMGASALEGATIAVEGAAQATGIYLRVKSAVETYEQFQQITSSIFENGFEAGDAEKLLMAASTAIAERLAGKMASKLAMQVAGRSGLTRLLGTARDNLLGAATNPKLKGVINELYRDRTGKNIIGSGSAMDAFRYERATGTLLSPKGHGQKLINYRSSLMKLLNNPGLDGKDKQIVKDLLIDIQSALSGG
jgi:RHS repeat-associated protein